MSADPARNRRPLSNGGLRFSLAESTLLRNYLRSRVYLLGISIAVSDIAANLTERNGYSARIDSSFYHSITLEQRTSLKYPSYNVGPQPR